MALTANEGFEMAGKRHKPGEIFAKQWLSAVDILTAQWRAAAERQGLLVATLSKN
jgi:hypothetical protein